MEYGEDCLEVHTDAIAPGDRVLLMDDLLATGGSANAASKLVQQLGGTLIDCAFIIELKALMGRAVLESKGCSVFSLCEY